MAGRHGKARKRGNGAGSITHLTDGRYQARITLENGRRKAYYAKTRADAERKLRAVLSEMDRGVLPVPEQQTLGRYLEEWIADVRPEIEPSTWRRYHDFVRVHLVPGLGKNLLARLTAQQVQRFYTRKLEEGLSGTTVRHLHGVLHRALSDALRLGLVQRNVSELARRPRRSTSEMHPLTEEQARRLLDAAMQARDRFTALYVLALTTGMREGELLALHWLDVDLKAGTVQVRLGVQESKSSQGRYVLAEPKTDRSRRTIGLTQTAMAVLREHHTRQAEARLRAGAGWETTHDLVFPNRRGGLMIPDNMTKRSFKPLLRQTGLPNIRFHDLRHTAATLLLTRGVQVKLVSEMLGHADVTTTLRTYSHVLPHMHQAAVAVMDGVFGMAVEG